MNPVDSQRKRVLIVGASETGLALARTLCTTWEVAVLDSNPERLQPLRELQLPEARLNLFTKDGTSLLNLKDAGLVGAEWVIALTERDDANVEVCRAALSIEPPPAAIAVVGSPHPAALRHCVATHPDQARALLPTLLAYQLPRWPEHQLTRDDGAEIETVGSGGFGWVLHRASVADLLRPWVSCAVSCCIPDCE